MTLTVITSVVRSRYSWPLATLLCPTKFGSGCEMSRGFPSHKNVTFPTDTNILISPKLGGKTYMSVMAINQPLTGKSRRGKCVD